MVGEGIWWNVRSWFDSWGSEGKLTNTLKLTAKVSLILKIDGWSRFFSGLCCSFQAEFLSLQRPLKGRLGGDLTGGSMFESFAPVEENKSKPDGISEYQIYFPQKNVSNFSFHMNLMIFHLPPSSLNKYRSFERFRVTIVNATWYETQSIIVNLTRSSKNPSTAHPSKTLNCDTGVY